MFFYISRISFKCIYCTCIYRRNSSRAPSESRLRSRKARPKKVAFAHVKSRLSEPRVLKKIERDTQELFHAEMNMKKLVGMQPHNELEKSVQFFGPQSKWKKICLCLIAFLEMPDLCFVFERGLRNLD